MKIVVAGGQNKADFLIGLLLEKKHKIKIINDNADYGTYLAKSMEYQFSLMIPLIMKV